MATPPMLRPRDAASPRPVLRPRRDPVAAVSATLLALTAVGLLLGGILAVYDWTTPGAEQPLVFAVLGTFFAAFAVEIAAATARRLRTTR